MRRVVSHRRFTFESLGAALTGNVIGRLVQICALLLSAIVLARLLGPTGLGVVAIASATVRLATIPVEEGAARLCERELAGAIGKTDPSQAVAALRFSTVAALTLGAVGAVAVGLLLPVDPLSEAGRGVGLAALGLLAANVANAALRGVLRGEGQTTWAIKVTNAQSLLAPALYLCWTLGDATLSPAIALWLQAGSKLAFLPGLAFLVHRYWVLVGARGDGHTARIPPGWISESAQFALLGLVTVALAEVGTIMLGYLSTPEQAGLFRIASRAFLIAGFVAIAAQQAYGPRIAKEWQTGRGAALEHPSRIMSVAALAGALASLVAFALIGRPILVIAFGPAFEAAFLPSIIMVVGAVSVSLGAVSARLLKMTGEQGVVFRASLLALLLASGLNLVLIPFLGATGCAMASVAAVTLGRIVMNRGVKRHLGFCALPDTASAEALWRRMSRELRGSR
jgi:O-antigen/teichoic acid export membrane protein